jgi:hypothetical protein
LKNKWRKQDRILVEKETQEVLTLAGKCSDDNWLTVDSSSNPSSFIKARRKKQRIFKDKHRESQSLHSSVSRTKSTSSKPKLKILRTKPSIELSKQEKETIRSTKVQMILERHRKQNYSQAKTFRESDTMDYTLSSKMQWMSSQERRSKNRSNMSEQMMNSQFVRLTVGEEDSISKEVESRRYTREEVLSEASIEESLGILESKEENTESIDTSMNDTSRFKRTQGEESNLLDLEVKQQFYMNAPRQFDEAKFKGNSHLPPMSIRYESNSAIAKNKPHQSNSSKLMEQLQKKQNMKMAKTPKSKLINKNTSNGPFICKAKGSLILSSKWKPQNNSANGGSTKSQTPGSALSKYSDKARDLEENAVFLEDRGSSSKQFLTFTAPSCRKKEHKKNKSVGSKDNLNVPEAIAQSKVYMLNKESHACEVNRPLTDRNAWVVEHNSISSSHQAQKMSKFTMVHNLNNLTNRLIRKQVNWFVTFSMKFLRFRNPEENNKADKENIVNQKYPHSSKRRYKVDGITKGQRKLIGYETGTL